MISTHSICMRSSIHSNTGILCESFSPPSDEICPRDNVTFTCVVNSGVILWSVGPGDDDLCAYFSVSPTTDTCGPDGRFESSQTDVNGPANNSSLSVDLITNDLNGITVNCIDGGTGELIGSYDICIIGKNTIQLTFSHLINFKYRSCTSSSFPTSHYLSTRCGCR